MKLELKDLVMIMSIIGTAFAGFLYLNAQHANASDFDSFKIVAQREFVDIRIERIVMQLNSITRKEAQGFSSKYDIIRKEELEREWELLKEQKKNAG